MPLTCFNVNMAMGRDNTALIQKVESALPPHIGDCVMAIDKGDVVFEHVSGILSCPACRGTF